MYISTFILLFTNNIYLYIYLKSKNIEWKGHFKSHTERSFNFIFSLCHLKKTKC